MFEAAQSHGTLEENVAYEIKLAEQEARKRTFEEADDVIAKLVLKILGSHHEEGRAAAHRDAKLIADVGAALKERAST